MQIVLANDRDRESRKRAGKVVGASGRGVSQANRRGRVRMAALAAGAFPA